MPPSAPATVSVPESISTAQSMSAAETDGSSSSGGSGGGGGTDPQEKTDVSCWIMCSRLGLLERESTNFRQSRPAGLSVVYVPRLLIDCADGEPPGEEGQPLRLTKSGLERRSCLWEVVGEEVEKGEEERQRGRERQRMGVGWWWEKMGPDSPFNLLINHANEILTGYSEAFLQGGRKTLALDYTLSMWSVRRSSEICCRTK